MNAPVIALKLPKLSIAKPAVALTAAPQPAVVQQPAKAAAPKAKRVIPDNDYRKMRKWTTLKMEPFLADDRLREIRATLGSKGTGVLTAAELVAYLKTQEDEKPEPKAAAPVDPNKPKRGPGRPLGSKNKAKADKSATVTPAANPAATLKAAANGVLVRKPTLPVLPKLGIKK